jgi:hypothetical protein
LPEPLGRDVSPGSGFQELRRHVSSCSDFAVRYAFTDFVERRP